MPDSIEGTAASGSTDTAKLVDLSGVDDAIFYADPRYRTAQSSLNKQIDEKKNEAQSWRQKHDDLQDKFDAVNEKRRRSQ